MLRLRQPVALLEFENQETGLSATPSLPLPSLSYFPRPWDTASLALGTGWGAEADKAPVPNAAPQMAGSHAGERGPVTSLPCPHLSLCLLPSRAALEPKRLPPRPGTEKQDQGTQLRPERKLGATAGADIKPPVLSMQLVLRSFCEPDCFQHESHARPYFTGTWSSPWCVARGPRATGGHALRGLGCLHVAIYPELNCHQVRHPPPWFSNVASGQHGNARPPLRRVTPDSLAPTRGGQRC